MPEDVLVATGAAVATPAAAETAGPTFRDHVATLSATERDHWQLTGELPNEIDVSSASSPETASETLETAVENEAASEPAVEEQPKVGETPEQKSERKRRNDARRLRDFHKVEVELATERTKRELLEKQIAESKTAPAPVKEVAKVDPNKPKRPRLDDPKLDTVEKYEAAMDAYEEARAQYDSQTVDQRERARSQEFEFKTASEKWETIKTSGRTKFKDFDAVAFNPKIPASLAAIVEMQSREDGYELMYHLGKNPGVAKELAEATDIPGPYKTYAELTAQALKDPQFALTLGEKRGIAKAEIARIAKSLTKSKAAPAKETIARQSKPSGEVAVEANTGPVEDELAEAIRTKNQDAYNRIMNKREMAGASA